LLKLQLLCNEKLTIDSTFPRREHQPPGKSEIFYFCALYNVNVVIDTYG